MKISKKFLKKISGLMMAISFSACTSIVAMAIPPKKGIDVSVHQGNIDWQQVKDSGIEFAMIRTSFGKELYEKQTDRKFRDNVAGAKSVGIPIGAYHYSYATSIDDARREADFFITRLKDIQWEYPVCYDLEDSKTEKLDKATITNIARTFIDRVRSAGYYVALYVNLNWARNKLDMNALRDVDIWIAQWYSRCQYNGEYGIWQYTNSGRVPGINGNVDMNISYKDYPQIIKLLHKNGF